MYIGEDGTWEAVALKQIERQRRQATVPASFDYFVNAVLIDKYSSDVSLVLQTHLQDLREGRWTTLHRNVVEPLWETSLASATSQQRHWKFQRIIFQSL